MSNWPDIEDRYWPHDIPQEYFHHEQGERRGLKAAGLIAVVLGLCHRVEYLENRVRELENRP